MQLITTLFALQNSAAVCYHENQRITAYTATVLHYRDVKVRNKCPYVDFPSVTQFKFTATEELLITVLGPQFVTILLASHYGVRSLDGNPAL